MRSRKYVPLHIVRWMRKLDRAVSLQPRTKFVDYGEGLLRQPGEGAQPEYRWKTVRTKVVTRDW
ncbi:hypothetical protein [Rhizobium laguerreae]|uniref:hypothetical protein n=1 Tax=Rhizobium laguerreae TaxID=1076926 RepID=UPI001C927F27|nr:hypothetical protein [Rhizobium laguerreae]